MHKKELRETLAEHIENIYGESQYRFLNTFCVCLAFRPLHAP